MNLCEVSESRKDREVAKALQLLPTGLDATYIRSLEQIEKQKDYMRRLAFKTLRWVVYAQRPLTTDELRCALAAEEELITRVNEELDDIDVILGACAHLLVEDTSNYRPVVRPIHYSVQEFFTTLSSSALQGRLLKTFHDLNQVHARLAEICISHLQSKLLDQHPCAKKNKLDTRMEDYPFLWYAACAFDHHLICCTSPPKELIKSMTMFLEQSGLFLASVLQLKAVPSYTGQPQEPDPIQDFDSYAWTVDKRTVVYSTKIYDVPDLEDSWRGLRPPPTALHRACSAGLSSAVSRLLAGEIEVNEIDDNGLAPIYYGTVSGNAAIVRMLVERGADVKAQGGYYGNALQAAAFGGHKSIASLLLEYKADVNAQGGSYGNALQAAACGGHESIVRLLLENEADVNAQGGSFSNTLQVAAREGHESIIRLLLENEADVNAQGGHYGNALQAAAFGGHESIVRLLLENEADVNAQGGHYGNALQAAACGGHESIIRLLLENKADVNAQGGSYGNALQAAAWGDHESIIRLLLENEADVNAQDRIYGNALQAAACIGHESIVRLLLENEADVNAQGGHYGNALQAAACGGYESIIRLLLENKADVDAQGGHYGNALQAAAYQGHKSIVRLLLENKKDVNA
jgi:ankyrin repeat protein